jgi:hypothetical protein
MTERIEGTVAQILNRFEVVLTVGSEHGVDEGMRFAVLNRKGAQIRDPKTNEELGSVEIPKVILQVTRVQPKLSVARTFRTIRRNVGGRGFGLDVFQPPKWVEERESLRTQDRPYEEELDESESYVKIGDPAVQVLGDEFLTTR